MEVSEGICCACHKENQCFCIRKGVTKCADCICNQIGRSTMDLFRKGTQHISSPVHVLVAISGGASSMFLWDLFQKRLIPSLNGKTAIVRKLEAISSKDIPTVPDINKIAKFSIASVVDFAKSHNFNCVVFADCVDHVSLANIATLACGRPDLAHWLSTDDINTNYSPVTVLRPVRQCLLAEIQFYCDHNNIAYDKTLSAFEKAFSHEEKMLKNILEDGNGGIPFAVQKMGEKLPSFDYPKKCPNCGLPSPSEDICEYCATIQKFE